MNIIALCAFRNAHDLLPGFLDQLRDHVAGAILYDDGSTTGGIGICEQHPIVIGTVEDTRGTQHPPHSREVENRLCLLGEAMRRDADWILALDVDFRLESRFWSELPFLVDQEPQSIFSLRLRDLWNSEDQYRTDGVWSTKRLMALFPGPRQDDLAHYHAPGLLHTPWVPPRMWARLAVVDVDFNIYHLGSQTPEMRAARVAKFEQIDPSHTYQANYSYLASDEGAVLEAIPEGRGWK